MLQHARPRCNPRRFVEDVSVPDRSAMRPNEPFTKSWRFRNESSESWPPTVELTFVGPTDIDRMGSPPVVPVESGCASGEEIVVSVALVAPASKGRCLNSHDIPIGHDPV